MGDRPRNEILGIQIDSRSQDELERVMVATITGSDFIRIATVNPEFFVRAKNDDDFRSSLLSADIRVADGSGVVLAGLLNGYGVSRYPGADLMRFILSAAEKNDVPVYLAVRNGGLSSFDDVRAAVGALYPRLSIVGADIDPAARVRSNDMRNTTVVLCNFGAPEQESFLESLRANPGNIRLAMGVGGSFDYLTGRRPRAPRWMRSSGLEWLFRLAIQPTRAGRIWIAVVIFPFLCLSDRMRGRKQ
ncbi:MAG: WecB/TagA/CpsF family glycosyltransferase [Candidatus Moranbacteria bacterium]|nr:WecB/TagA/CpsF family glycosyltransferase [Candidatus Moranbacteria bacterium]